MLASFFFSQDITGFWNDIFLNRNLDILVLCYETPVLKLSALVGFLRHHFRSRKGNVSALSLPGNEEVPAP